MGIHLKFKRISIFTEIDVIKLNYIKMFHFLALFSFTNNYTQRQCYFLMLFPGDITIRFSTDTEFLLLDVKKYFVTFPGLSYLDR